MTELSREILSLMHTIGEHPAVFGSEGGVHGIVVGLTAIILRVELGLELDVSLRITHGLVFLATADVARQAEWFTELCDDELLPGTRRSYDAISRHMGPLSELAVSLIHHATRDRRVVDEFLDSVFAAELTPPISIEDVLRLARQSKTPPID